MEALKGVSLSWTDNLMVIILFGIMLFWEKIPKSKVCGEKKKKKKENEKTSCTRSSGQMSSPQLDRIS